MKSGLVPQFPYQETVNLFGFLVFFSRKTNHKTRSTDRLPTEGVSWRRMSCSKKLVFFVPVVPVLLVLLLFLLLLWWWWLWWWLLLLLLSRFFSPPSFSYCFWCSCCSFVSLSSAVSVLFQRRSCSYSSATSTSTSSSFCFCSGSPRKECRF